MRRENEEIAGAAGKRCPGCNRAISINKEECASCIGRKAKEFEAKAQNPAPGSTHIVVVHESQDQEDLYRADGMLVASRQKDVVRFGHDIGTAQTRLFFNASLAMEWLRKLAQVDIYAHEKGVALHEVIWQYGQITRPVDIESRFLEKSLIIPATMKLN